MVRRRSGPNIQATSYTRTSSAPPTRGDSQLGDVAMARKEPITRSSSNSDLSFPHKPRLPVPIARSLTNPIGLGGERCLVRTVSAESSGAATVMSSVQSDQIGSSMQLPHVPERKVSSNNGMGPVPMVSSSNGMGPAAMWGVCAQRTTPRHLGRYTVDKLLAFDEYQRVSSPVRVFGVIALTPLPSLLVVILLAAIPLQNPLLSVKENASYFIQSAMGYSAVIFGLLLFIRRALGWTSKLYSHREAALVAVFTAITNELVMLGIAVLWRFPTPFDPFVRFPSFAVLFLLGHKLVLGTRLRHHHLQVFYYLPLLNAQFSTLFVFQMISFLFINVSANVQMALTMTFPIMRAVLKRVITSFTHSLDDISTDVTVSVAEVFGSLFQNICLQGVQSPAAAALLILVDLVQALVEAKLYLAHKFIVDGRQATHTAVKIVEGALFPGALNSGEILGVARLRPSPFAFLGDSLKGTSTRLESSQTQSKTSSQGSWSYPWKHKGSKHPSTIAVASAEPFSDQLGISSMAPVPAAMALPRACIDDIDIPHRENAKLLAQTLQLLFASEVLVFAEYAEFACAGIYGVYTLALYHLPYAKYSLSFIGVSELDFWVSLQSTVIYASLEGASLLLLFVLIRGKYGFSTLYQLAFVLEKYWMSVQGKLLSSLGIIFILSTVHHGMDLSLEFDWEKVLNGTTGI